MRGQSRGWARSVDRGTCRRGIEPRNTWKSGCRPCLLGGKATLVGAISRALTGPARSETPDMHGTSTCENREALPASDTKLWADRSRKVMSHNLDMNAGRESDRSEEHTSELQSRRDLVCRLLLEKKKKIQSVQT